MANPNSDAPLPGWYGLQPVGDSWCPVTPEDGRITLILPEAERLGATHVGYWTGKGWEHVQLITEVR